MAPHQRAHLIDRCRQNARECRKHRAQDIGGGEQNGDINAKGLDQTCIFSSSSQIAADLRLLDEQPDQETGD